MDVETVLSTVVILQITDVEIALPTVVMNARIDVPKCVQKVADKIVQMIVQMDASRYVRMIA